MTAPSARALAALAALAAAVILGFAWDASPSPVPLDAPASGFSSARARAHLETIARRPHPSGSAEHERVRAYLVEQLRALGLAPEIQEAVAARMRYQPARFAAVKNVIARRRGTGTGKALLLMAHYDSRGMTPGASDDGYGAATLLETARALQTGGATASDVLFLFTDAEEGGMLGAQAFVDEHPSRADVGLVLNFEARGNSGPVMMFQTGDDNAAVVRELARAVSRPTASSLFQAVYRRMPNDTDLSVWLPRTPALNFANVGGFERYHAPTDTAENVDERTLQHHGTYALALARAFADRSLPLPREGDAVYFDCGPFFVRYPGAWERPLAFAAAILVAAFVVVGRRRGALPRWGRERPQTPGSFGALRPVFVGVGLLAVLALMVIAGVASALLWALAARLHPSYRLVNAASPVLKGLYLASFVALAAAIVVGAQALLGRWIRAAELFAGGAVLCAVVALATALAVPGTSFPFTWPLLAAVLPALGLVLTGPFDRDTPGGVAAVIAASVPPLFLVGPFIPQLFGVFGPSAGPGVAALAALLVAFAAPAVRLVLVPAPRLVPLAALALAAACYLAGNLRAPFDRDYPRPDTLLYAIDADHHRAWWLSPDPEPDAWTATALAGATRESAAPLPFPIENALLAAPATEASEPAGAEIAWLSDVAAGARREVRLRVIPPAGGELLGVRVEGVLSGRVEGREVALDEGALGFRFHAPPARGVEVEVSAAAGAPVTVRAVVQWEGFPAGAMPAVGARPQGMMAKPGMMPPWDELLESDRTIVAKSWVR